MSWTLTHVAAPPTVTRWCCGSHHVLWVLYALSQGSPFSAALVLVSAIAWRVMNLVEWGHTDPLCRWPFLAFYDRASTMEAHWIGGTIWFKVEEKEGVPFPWFHWGRSCMCIVKYAKVMNTKTAQVRKLYLQCLSEHILTRLHLWRRQTPFEEFTDNYLITDLKIN